MDLTAIREQMRMEEQMAQQPDRLKLRTIACLKKELIRFAAKEGAILQDFFKVTFNLYYYYYYSFFN